MQKSWKPPAAGVLTIIGGALNIIASLGMTFLMPVAAPFAYALVTVGLFGVLWLGAGVMALVGGIFALQRRRWGLSLAGAICALMPPATLLGIVSTVFVALSREEFGAEADSSQYYEPELRVPHQITTPANSPYDATGAEPGDSERNA